VWCSPAVPPYSMPTAHLVGRGHISWGVTTILSAPQPHTLLPQETSNGLKQTPVS
jgi:hypothetical protein